MKFFKDVTELVRKNIKNLIRAKASSLVVILGPLLIIFLAGMAFDNSNVYSVKVGAFESESNEVTKSIIEQLDEQFKVIEYTDQEDCINAIKTTDVNTCIIFPPGFAIGETGKNELIFYVDYSRINLVWAVMGGITEQVGERSLSESQDLAKVLLDTLEYTQEKVGEQRRVVVELTTQNDLILRNTQDLISDLDDIDLSLDEGSLDISDLESANTQVKQWVDNSLDLGVTGLSKAISFINAANTAVKASGAGANEEVVAAFQKNVDDVKKLQADMEDTTE